MQASARQYHEMWSRSAQPMDLNVKTSLWMIVAGTCARKDWAGYIAFLGFGVVGYPSFSALLVLGCIAVLLIVALLRVACTYFYIRQKLERLHLRQPANEAENLEKYCDTHIRGIFG
jgi:hypothetical protein